MDMLHAANQSNKKPYDATPAYRPPVTKKTAAGTGEETEARKDTASLALGLGTKLNLYV